MLVAVNEFDDFISLADNWSKERLQYLREQQTFYCPACQHPLTLKIGSKRTWHFAHQTGSDCSAQTEPESEYHLQGKLQLYDWLKQQFQIVKLEPYIQEVRQRPDIMFSHKGQPFVIEFQCSTIDSQLFIKRNQAYEYLGYIPIWILGGKRLRRRSENMFQVPGFDWNAALFTPSLFLLYFCPRSKQLLKLSSLTPFSPQQTIANMEYRKLPETSFFQVLQTNPEPDQFMQKRNETWLNKKRRWRLNATFNVKSIHRTFIYESGISLSLIPSEAGLPLLSLPVIQTPAILWQAWVLIHKIIPLRKGSSFTIHEVYVKFKEKVRSGMFVIRRFPVPVDLHEMSTLAEYLELLCRLGILKQIGSGVFLKEREVLIPRSIDEALREDRKVFSYLNK